jgi:hypothetical protein
MPLQYLYCYLVDIHSYCMPCTGPPFSLFVGGMILYLCMALGCLILFFCPWLFASRMCLFFSYIIQTRNPVCPMEWTVLHHVPIYLLFLFYFHYSSIHGHKVESSASQISQNPEFKCPLTVHLVVLSIISNRKPNMSGPGFNPRTAPSPGPFQCLSIISDTSGQHSMSHS